MGSKMGTGGSRRKTGSSGGRGTSSRKKPIKAEAEEKVKARNTSRKHRTKEPSPDEVASPKSKSRRSRKSTVRHKSSVRGKGAAKKRVSGRKLSSRSAAGKPSLIQKGSRPSKSDPRIAGSSAEFEEKGHEEGITDTWPLPPGAIIDGRYRVVEHLGQGTMARVYRVADQAGRRGEVALKLLQKWSTTRGRGFLFQREFLCMNRLPHPNIVEVYDFGMTKAGTPYFTMEYVAGHSLNELDPGAGFETIFSVFTEILETLSFIHSRTVLHRDLKPQNLLWFEEEGRIRVKITDFGLAESTILSSRKPFLGTVLYTPPEVACGMKPDQRSDLYSLGVVFHEVLAGRPPFMAKEPVAVLRQHLDTEPPPLIPKSDDIPPALIAIVQRMLLKRRGDRFQSTEEVLRALDELSPRIRLRSTVAPASVLTGDFVGRELELMTLSEALDSARENRGRVLFIGGEAGAGKSRLLKEFRAVVQIEGMNVAQVQCQDKALHPYQPLAELLGQLGVNEALARKLGLEPLLQIEQKGALPPAERRGQLIGAFVDFLTSRSKEQPLTLLFEELHNAGEGTFEALKQLARDIGDFPILVVATYLHEAAFSSYVWEERSSLAELIGELSGGEAFSDLVLGRLSPEDVETMIASMLGQDELPEGLLEFATEEAEGSPFVVEELMKALLQGGALVRDEAGWRLEKKRLQSLSLPTSVREIFDRRLELCSPEARKLAELVSVLGRRADYGTLERLCPDQREELAEWLDELMRLEVLVSEDFGGKTYCHVQHNRLREALYEAIPPEQRLELHQRVARYLEEGHRDRLEEVAAELEHHYLKVGARKKIRIYASMAAKVARRSFAYDRAIESLERCQRVEDSPEMIAHLTLEIAELCSVVGRFGKAERLYQEWLDAASEANPEEFAEVLRRQGEIYHKRGELRRAISCFEEALEQVPEERYLAVTGRCLANLADSTRALGNIERAQDFGQRALAVAESLGDLGERAHALETLGKIAASHRAFAEAQRNLSQALELRHLSNDSLGVAWLETQLGDVAERSGDLELALEHFQKAEELFAKMSFPRGQAVVQRNLGQFYHRHKVAWELALDYYNKSLALLERLGDDYGASWTFYWLGRLHEDRGQLDKAVELYLRNLSSVNQVKVYTAMGGVLMRLGHVYLLKQERVKAEFYLRQALSKFQKVGDAEPWDLALLWAWRGLCSLEENEFDEAKARTDRALDLLPQGEESSEKGQVLLAQAVVLRRMGRLDEAEEKIVEGYELLRTKGTTFDRAYANLVRGRHLMVLGRDEEALRFLEHAREIFEKIGAKSILQEARARITRIGEKQIATFLGDRTDPGNISTLYQISQIFNSTLELKELLDRVMKVVVLHIHAERGYLILRDETSGEWRARSVAHGESSPEEIAAVLSSGIIEMVVESGRPILSPDAQRDPRFADNVPLQLFGIKSLLCTPLRAQERVVGVIYLDHREETGRFSERDLEFLRLLATHASRAMDNALLYERYRTTMDSLNIGIIALNPSGAIVTCNRHVDDLLGGKMQSLLRANGSRGILGKMVAQVVGGVESMEQILCLDLGRGENKKLQVRVKQLRDGHGRVLGALCFLRDITVLERLKELLTRENRLTAMGELASKVAERIRNYLSGIRLLSQGLEKHLADDPRVEYVQEILLEVEEADRYVSEQLSPKAADVREPDNMSRLLGEVCASMEPECENRGIAFVREFGPDLPILRVQSLQLKEALVNLCRNAVQALGAGGMVSLSAKLTRYDSGRKLFEISISDNGPGIPVEHRTKIFDPFFTTKEEGHGVGLWMVHRVVADHGGKIDLETEEGIGSTFTLQLPV